MSCIFYNPYVNVKSGLIVKMFYIKYISQTNMLTLIIGKGVKKIIIMSTGIFFFKNLQFEEATSEVAFDYFSVSGLVGTSILHIDRYVLIIIYFYIHTPFALL